MLKAFLEQILGDSEDAGAAKPAIESAAAALLAEVALADGELSAEETETAVNALAKALALPRSASEAAFAAAVDAHGDRVGVQDMTRMIVEQWSMEDRIALVEALWSVSLADAGIDPFEEHRVRHIADLLYVSHTAFIQAKRRARTRADRSSP
ncbi:MAG: TerB family tellurite resistance protein [Pseudomonadota bacterium]